MDGLQYPGDRLIMSRKLALQLSNFCASSLLEASRSRSLTKARTTWMPIVTARGEFSAVQNDPATSQ
jgi:hypothetical protein